MEAAGVRQKVDFSVLRHNTRLLSTTATVRGSVDLTQSARLRRPRRSAGRAPDKCKGGDTSHGLVHNPG